MAHFVSFHKRKIFCFVIFFLVVSSFTADIFDLREELQILSYSYNSLDDDITTGMTDRFVLDTAPILTLSRGHCNSSVVIAFSHLPSCGFRAPPSQS